MSIIKQDRYWEAVNKSEAERIDGLDAGMSFETALKHYFRKDSEQRRRFLVEILLGKKKKAEVIINEIAGYLGADISFFKNMRVLDVGSGSGGASVAFAKAGAIVTAIDSNASITKLAEIRARENNVTVDILNKNAINSSLSGDYFDFVFAEQVIEHIKDVDAFLKEICRVLKPGGWHSLIFQTNTVLEKFIATGFFSYPIYLILSRQSIYASGISASGNMLFFHGEYGIHGRAKFAD